jgi:hypothetical protein
MKRFRLYLTALVASVMAACSSMEVDDDELYSENFPKDFVDTVYMQLNPALRSRQIVDYIVSYNDSLKKNMKPEAYSEMFSKDSAAFYEDTSVIHEIFVNPFYLGMTEETWEDMWLTTYVDKVTCEKEKTIKEINLIMPSDTPRIIVDSVHYKAGTTIGTIYGKTAADPTSKAYVLGDTIKISNQDVAYDSLDICDTVTTEKPGALSGAYKSYLFAFNIYNALDDLAALKKVPLDLTPIAYHYVVYGKMHGLAYRRCTKEEKKNPVRPVLSINDTVDNLYCDDNGVIRQIN